MTQRPRTTKATTLRDVSASGLTASFLTREQILAFNDIRTEKVPVPEWHGHVYVRMLTVGERARWEEDMEARKKDPTRPHPAAAFTVLAACDESGHLLFTEADLPALTAKSCAAVDRVVEAAIRLNKVSMADIEALEGESKAAHRNGSASDSPVISG